MLLSPWGLTATASSTSVVSQPAPRRAAVTCAAVREEISEAAVCMVRVGSGDSRSTWMPMKVVSSWGSGETRSWAVVS